MTTKHLRTSVVRVASMAVVLAVVLGQHDVYAYKAAPIKEVVLAHFGQDVDKTTGASLCTVESQDECGAGQEADLAGGFTFPGGVAVAPDDDVYVADTVNNRVQELSPGGQFVSMFGWEVNRTKDESPSATPAEKNVCTAISGDVCKAGVAGGSAGQIADDHSIVVDQMSGNVYVEDLSNWRIDEFTPNGAFVLMFGKSVNKTKVEQAGTSEEERNICTAVSGDICQAGTSNSSSDAERGTFNFEGLGDLLAIGGPQHLLYVGDEHRVQEFDPATGKWKDEISLTGISAERESKVVALTLDDSCARHQPPLTEVTIPTCAEFDPDYGDLYLVYRDAGGTGVVRKFTANGSEVKDGHFPLALAPRASEGEQLSILALALDVSNRLAISGFEQVRRLPVPFGDLYEGGTGRLITEFASAGTNGLAFSGGSELYGVETVRHEVVAYHPVSVAEPTTVSPVLCSTEPDDETDAIYDCTLQGAVDPWGVKETEAWFQWGESINAQEATTPQNIPIAQSEGEEEPLATIEALINGLWPNATYYYLVAAYDANVRSPEAHLSSEIASFTTPFVAPKIVGPLATSFVRPLSVVMQGEVNPENAATQYFFEYAAEGEAGNSLAVACPKGIRQELAKCVQAGVRATSAFESGLYGKIGVAQEARGLLPDMKYRFRLFAESQSRSNAERRSVFSGEEGEFTTSAAAMPLAVTGTYSALTPSSVVISGAVNPDGEPATYTFEFGVYNGTATQYTSVSWMGVPATTAYVPVSTTLMALQPNTTYAYRVRLKGGFGSVEGATATFTTPGFPPVPPIAEVPLMLPVPPVHLPGGKPPPGGKPQGLKCARVRKRTSHQDRRCRKGGKAHKRRHTARKSNHT